MTPIIPTRIQIPLASCAVSPILVTPYTTEDRLEYLQRCYEEGAELPLPIVRPLGGRFECIQGWDVVNYCQTAGLSVLPVQHGDYTDEWVLRLGVVEQAKLLELSWLQVADALAKVKRHWGWPDQRIATAAGMDRTRVNRFIAIANTIPPALRVLATRGRVSYSLCRDLLSLDSGATEALAIAAVQGDWSERRLREAAFPDKQRAPRLSTGVQPHHESIRERKTTDIRRLETYLSEKIGFPVAVEQASEGKKGELSFSFFSLQDLVEIFKKLQAGMELPRPSVEGRLIIDFSTNTELNAIVARHIKEDGWD